MKSVAKYLVICYIPPCICVYLDDDANLGKTDHFIDVNDFIDVCNLYMKHLNYFKKNTEKLRFEFSDLYQ